MTPINLPRLKTLLRKLCHQSNGEDALESRSNPCPVDDCNNDEQNILLWVNDLEKDKALNTVIGYLRGVIQVVQRYPDLPVLEWGQPLFLSNKKGPFHQPERDPLEGKDKKATARKEPRAVKSEEKQQAKRGPPDKNNPRRARQHSDAGRADEAAKGRAVFRDRRFFRAVNSWVETEES